MSKASVGMRFSRWLLAVAAALICLPAAASAAGIVNGDFETGNLEGWTAVEEGGTGVWSAYTGTTLPPPFDFTSVPAPPQGNYAAITAQTGPGTRFLYQDFAVPAGTGQALSMFVYYSTGASLVSPENLDFDAPESNQQYRIDLIKPSAPLQSLDPSDVLLNLFKTESGDPQALEPKTISADLATLAGQTVRLRIAEVDNQDNFFAGVDAVTLTGGSIPPPPPPAKLGEVWLGKPVAKNRKTGVSTIAVGLPAAGTLKVEDLRASTGKGKPRIQPVTVAVPKTETVNVQLKPTSDALKALKKGGKVSLRAAFTLTLADGRTISLDRLLALRLAKPNAY